MSDGTEAEVAEAAQQLRTHIMARYRDALLAYATASSFRTLSTPEDLVHGFFAERLHDIAYLRTWQGSGMKLRRWLCNGLLLDWGPCSNSAQGIQASEPPAGHLLEDPVGVTPSAAPSADSVSRASR